MDQVKLNFTIQFGAVNVKYKGMTWYDLANLEEEEVWLAFLKTLLHKPSFWINTKNIFIEIFLRKSKPVLIGILCRPPNKCDLLSFLKCTFSDTNVSESQECYLLFDINMNLQLRYKETIRSKSASIVNKGIPHLTRTCLEYYFIHSLEQIIARQTRVIDQTATLIDYILTNSPEKVSQSSVIDLGPSDHDLIYCRRKTSLQKFHKHNEIFVCSRKKYSAGKFLMILREIIFPNYMSYTGVNDAF